MDRGRRGKPLRTGRLLAAVVSRTLLREDGTMELSLVIDHACNLRCSYCYAGAKNPHPMSREVAESAVRLALSRDPTGLELSFFGGEPLLHVRFMKEITAFAEVLLREKRPDAALVVHLNTNACLVTDAVESYVRSCPRINAFVSLDGPQTVHDRHRCDIRGQGSYEAVRDGLRRLHGAGAKVVALAVTNPDTVGELGAVVAEFLSLPLVRAHITPNLRATWDETAISSLKSGLLDAMAVWGAQFRAGKAFVLEPFTTKILSHLLGAMPCARRCQLAAHEIVVAPSGRLYPCGEMVGDDDDGCHVIGDVWAGVDEAALLRLRAQKDRVETLCADCAIRARCSSSCGCKQVALTGNLGELTDVFCDLEEAFIEAADTLAASLHGEGVGAFRSLFYETRWLSNAGTNLLRLGRRPSPTVASSH